MKIGWLALAISILCSGGGNILAKISRRKRENQRHLFVLVSLSCYALGLITYPLSLTALPLSVAYPMLIGGSVSVVALFAVSLLGERLLPAQVVGLMAIIVGAAFLI